MRDVPLYQRNLADAVAADVESIVAGLFEADRDWRLDPVEGAGRPELARWQAFRLAVKLQRPAAWAAFSWLKAQQNAVTPDADLFRCAFAGAPGVAEYLQASRPLVWAAVVACDAVRPENRCPRCGPAGDVLVCEIQGLWCQRCAGPAWLTPWAGRV